MALASYFKKVESVVPEFNLQAWSGKECFAQTSFSGRAASSREFFLPMQSMVSQQDHDVVVDKTGTGRCYYRLFLQYARNNLNLSAQNSGFNIARIYEPIGDDADVRQDENGVWHLKAGAMIRVRLVFSVSQTRHHVAIVDNLAAGTEIMNKSLSGRTGVPEALSVMMKPQDLIDHENLRDDRAEIFCSVLHPSQHSYTYVARATNRGRFVAPPARAEEMYNSETYGRSSTDFIIVE